MNEALSSPRLGAEKSAGQNRNGFKGDHFGYALKTPVVGWFDVRVFYVRVTSCPLDDAPEVLTMRYPPRDISTALEANGGRISPSEELKLTLRRDRVDTESSEATYVSTDNLRASGSVSFEVYDREQLLLCGNLERSDPKIDTDGDDRDRSMSTLSKSIKLGWKMDLNCAVTSPGCSFLKGRQEFSTAVLSPPTMEVCVVGRYSALPVILTEVVQLTVRRKMVRRNTLDSIVEGEEGERIPSDLLLAGQPEQVSRDEGSYNFADKALARFGSFDPNGYGEGDEADSWFGTGVRVGVGIGLGMCLGVGIGVGLLVRTYQATTRSFRRNLF
ncbi:hypothetical protein MPTK1_8g04290 [Marchantia polymorpha subsp. ruderalis]|uniref:Erythronate-4-phosphate dehydrogenase family protein n=2 Tax=Marchantia polymorpha TaxID=3197 RepID=A0A176VI97_MARPO|nr:hypothetical protein AXG93_789s1050 [Marchantia polymorpha subsp. ruderalis]PTQ27405.1 hypothetical protein MARPO_0200s0005 [Marchantia polymorpha]BBN18653.1 hypothetical protein Mp_8g04290 [Marchantia polymorpha subsp. ruderalis]|eukprot:PTQ27405.1 hypothetical protein MARPO_0200s0005 [Marchantia polymorpha]